MLSSSRNMFALLSALAVFDMAAAASTYSQIKCLTKFGPTAVANVKTVTNVLTVPLYAYRTTTVTPQTTLTPSATTSTIRTTITSTLSTTQTQATDTFSTTTTLYSTATSTSTGTDSTTVTTTYTTTGTVTTTTVAASSGFIPIKSTIPNAAKRDALALPAVGERAATSTTQHLQIQNGKITCSPAIYPTAVSCAGLVEIVSTQTITKTATTTHTNTASTPTSFTTTTITTASTSTFMPVAASTTLSFTVTSTTTQITATTTTLTLSTSTTTSVSAPAATYYAACNSDNIAFTIGGQLIAGANTVDSGSIGVLAASTPYDCCVACITTSSCGGTLYAPGQCYLEFLDGTCTQSSTAFKLFTSPGGVDIYASNGYCGQDIAN